MLHCSFSTLVGPIGNYCSDGPLPLGSPTRITGSGTPPGEPQFTERFPQTVTEWLSCQLIGCCDAEQFSPCIASRRHGSEPLHRYIPVLGPWRFPSERVRKPHLQGNDPAESHHSNRSLVVDRAAHQKSSPICSVKGRNGYISGSDFLCAANRRSSTQVNSTQLNSTQLNSGQVRSGQVRSGQVRSGQVRSGQVKSSQVKSSQVKSSQLNSTQLNSTQLNSTQINSTQLNSIQLNNSTQLNSTQLNSTQLNSTQLNPTQTQLSSTQFNSTLCSRSAFHQINHNCCYHLTRKFNSIMKIPYVVKIILFREYPSFSQLLCSSSYDYLLGYGC